MFQIEISGIFEIKKAFLRSNEKLVLQLDIEKSASQILKLVF